MQKMSKLNVLVVLIVFGATCNSYAIDCMDLWDQDSINEMLEDRRRYQRSLPGHHHHDDEADLLDCCEEAEDDDDDGDDGDSDEECCHEDSSQEEPYHDDEHRHKREVHEIGALDVDDPEAGASDLEAAETHLFRPVFRYKSQYTERRRVRTAADGSTNFAPPRP
ncbi:nardilysin-like [Anopheles bellator]|uniref:nardilysin-like n=1 Tax=Anopheles bellator TaxID=139047 RepID=UPI002647A5DE|nr:nardilysin-like [Anopheles bellator]